MSRSSIWYILAALLVPAIFVATALFLAQSQDLYEADPDHAYLLNALNLLNLHKSGMWQHPGATVQIVGGIAIILTWILTFGQHGFNSINAAVIDAPEFYLQCIDGAMVTMSAAALIFLFARARSAAKALFPGIFGCATILISAPAFLSLHRVDPEPLLLAAAIALAAILVPTGFSGIDSKDGKKYALAMGSVFGFSLATKLTSVPLLLFVFLLPLRSDRMVAVYVTAITTIVLTLPVFRNYPDILEWCFGLLTHKHVYGNEIGVINFSQFMSSLDTLYHLSPETFIFLALYTLVLLARRFGLNMPDTAARTLLVCILVIITDVLLVTKQPQARYLISTLAPLCLGNVIASYYVLTTLKAKNWIGAALAFAFVAVGVSTQVSAANAEVADQLSNRKLVANAESENCLLIYYYEVKAVPYMLYFGNNWSGQSFSPDLARRYSKAVFFNNWTGGFENFGGSISTAEITARATSAKCINLIGSPLDRFEVGHFGIPERYLVTIVRTPGLEIKALALLRLDSAFFRRDGTN